MAKRKQDINIRLKRQEDKILKLTDQLEKEKDYYNELLLEKQEEDKIKLFEAYQKSRRNLDEIIDFMKGKADL